MSVSAKPDKRAVITFVVTGNWRVFLAFAGAFGFAAAAAAPAVA
jgi:hypothetical protein